MTYFLTQARFGLSHISGLVAGVMSVVAMVWIDVKDGRGGVTVRTANKQTNKQTLDEC